MAFFEKLLGNVKARRELNASYKLLTTYQPHFRRFTGKLYEMDAVRAALDAIARHVSKLEVKIDGAAQPKLQTIIKKRPNEVQVWSQFLARTVTILEMQNTVILIPVLNRSLETTGIWPVLPSRCRLLEDKRGEKWLEYKFSNGEIGAMELNRCGVVVKNQYEDDLFGEQNAALDDVLDLAIMQRQGIKEGIRSASTFRFMARSTNWKDPEDLAQEQENFTKRNLASDKSGFLLFPNNYDGIQLIQSKPYTISTDDQRFIKQSVNDYFGVNDAIIQNTAAGAELDAFFDGKIEPFAIQLEQVLTKMLFTETEQGYGAKVHVTANRLQYMSTGDKINFISQLGDRGMITINEARELLNYTAIEGGDVLPIRGEYYFVGQEQPAPEPEPEPEEITEPETPAEGAENGDQN